jgi:hypothetical protein
MADAVLEAKASITTGGAADEFVEADEKESAQADA